MYSKVKSEWKTFDEMNTLEQMDFRRFEGWKMYQKRIRKITPYRERIYEYLVETWKKAPE